MSVHGERPSDLVRERTLADREAEHALGYHERSGSVSRATPIVPRPQLPRTVGERYAQHGAAGEAAAANECVTLADRDFTAHPPAVNGPRVPAPQGARALTSTDDTTDSMNGGPVCGSADAVSHFGGRLASAEER